MVDIGINGVNLQMIFLHDFLQGMVGTMMIDYVEIDFSSSSKGGVEIHYVR